MKMAFIVLLGFFGGLALPLTILFFARVVAKFLRAPTVVSASIGGIIGMLMTMAFAMLGPLHFFNLIPLDNRMAFYMMGFGLGVVCGRLLSSKLQ
jgi:hypothetical protein